MTGTQSTQQDLNFCLKKTAAYMHEYGIQNWFISYGTLLGIIRNNSCIDKDDDVDIMIDKSEKYKLEKLIKEKGIKCIVKKPDFYKVAVPRQKATVDFYMSTMENENDYFDTWNNVIWSNCLPMIQKEWDDTVLHLPHDGETKLGNRYGNDWTVPIRSKGVVSVRRGQRRPKTLV